MVQCSRSMHGLQASGLAFRPKVESVRICLHFSVYFLIVSSYELRIGTECTENQIVFRRGDKDHEDHLANDSSGKSACLVTTSSANTRPSTLGSFTGDLIHRAATNTNLERQSDSSSRVANGGLITAFVLNNHAKLDYQHLKLY